MINRPDYDRAAAAAMQLLIDHQVKETPINPLPILLNLPGVRVLPYTKMASDAGIVQTYSFNAYSKCWKD